MSDHKLRTADSGTLFEQARSVLAGGVSHENRYAKSGPKYVTHACGSRKWDVDGHEYVDYAMGSASLVLGHAHPDVVDAVREQVERGTFFADCHPLEVEWGKLVQSMFPSAERVRFTASGTEATLLAIRVARAYSGRSKVLRFEGHYHGWHDYAIVGSAAPYGESPSLGVLPGAVEATVTVAPDANIVDETLAKDPGIGTIICEASGANYGSVPLPDGFLAALREIATRRDVVLIFDEVITGFRWSPGGRQARDGVIPDLTTLAKNLTGGMPGGGLAGIESMMRLLDPSVSVDGRSPAVTHKGTFNGSPLIAAGAIAALKHLATGEHQRKADAMAGRLVAGMRSIMEEHQVQGAVYGDSSTFHAYFGPCENGSVEGMSAAAVRSMPKDLVNGMRAAMRERGVDLQSYISGCTSSAHTDEDVEITLRAFEGAVEALVADGVMPR